LGFEYFSEGSISMMRRNKVLVSALALACAPVLGSIARGQTILFSDNFDAGTSAARWDLYSVDNEPATPLFGTPSAPGGDIRTNFNYNYNTFTYVRTGPNGIDDITGQIPSAPHSTGGTTTGLFVDVNNANTGTAIANLFPKLTEYLGGALPSGDQKLSFDAWINHNGRF